jgi:hypothetical protein
MITFLLGLACGAIIVGVGVWAAAIYEERMGREVGRVFKDRDVPSPDLVVKRGQNEGLYMMVSKRSAAGVRVCSCIGKTTRIEPNEFQYYIDPACPFHGGAA